MNTEDLLTKATQGKITQREIKLVADSLKNGTDEADAYTLIHILGRAEASAYEELVASYLEASDDPMLARIALQTLCSYWALTDHYLDDVIEFMRGVAWDRDDDVRLMAISIAGEHLRGHKEPALVQALLEVFSEAQQSRLARESAYIALGRAYGKDWKELPPASRHFDLRRDVDPRVLEWAKKEAARTEAAGPGEE